MSFLKGGLAILFKSDNKIIIKLLEKLFCFNFAVLFKSSDFDRLF